MARLFIMCFVLLTFATAVAAARPPITAAAGGADDCDGDVQALVANCQQYVQFPANPKIDPSAACCGVIQNADIPCLCGKVTPEVEKFICMDKVVFVAAYCKRPFKAGSTCGSKCERNHMQAITFLVRSRSAAYLPTG
ncbi:hypothetical protein ACQ4PT_048103 [Festuca glaucescens]